MMDSKEIDPKLFITCRLCLEDTGTYQIIPTVQHQIKYCFDIDVEPFDGLPQLLCKKCHTLLGCYTTTKKTFTEKQVTLKEKMTSQQEVKPEPAVPENCEANLTASNEVNPSAHSQANENGKKKKVTKSKRRKRVISSSSTESQTSIISHKRSRKSTPKNTPSKKFVNLKNNYTKYYVCKICSLMFRDKKSVRVHYYSHSYLKAMNHNIFDVQCMVRLPKLDSEPNLTGLNNTVALSKSRIIQHDNSDIYHILYIAKNKQYLKSDSSDNEIFVKSKQKKVRRLDSLSSDDTKVPTKNEKTDQQKVAVSDDIPVCIDLDDLSDSNTETAGLSEKKQLDTFEVDMKTIENIITVCRNKYETRLKKSQFTEKDGSRTILESQLKHKLLSFGRKNINVKGFNTTGLLRYLEHKNLNVVWGPVSQKFVESASREHSFVKVGAVKRHPNERTDADWGWTDVVDPSEEETSNTVDDCVAPSSSTALPNIIPVVTGISVSDLVTSVTVSSSELDPVKHIVVSNVRSIEETNSKKLLNVNPVANPKQLLPKKTYNETNLVMPVITSTTSLAAEVGNEVQKKDPEHVNNSSNDKPVPRIKVKPVAELMNPQKLIATDQQNHIWNFNQNMRNGTGAQDHPFTLLPNTLIAQIQNQSSAVLPISSSKPESPKISDYIILDTVDMPNTKTESPFEYFRNLLLLHGIVLVEANANISREYVCLLKFKVQFKQENKSNPVTLCLSLHCAENKFCMYIKNDFHINIHIAKMSAIWQWEIIKIFQGDVSTKILNNAQKAGSKIHLYTNTFLCLLKSITRILGE